MAATAYSYRRFSSGKQAGGSSLERQMRSTAAYAEANGLVLDTTLREDSAQSAYKGDHRSRGSFGGFLAEVQAGRVARGSYLLVDTMDRLSRQKLTTAANDLLSLANAGIRVVTMNDGAVFDEDAELMDLMQAAMKMQAAHDYSRTLSTRVAAGHARRKRQAREEGRVWSKRGPLWLQLDPETRRWHPLPARVEIIKRVFAWVVDDRLGTTVIAQRLNQEAAPTFLGGKLWHSTTITKIVRSRAILGEYQPRFADGSPDGDAIPGYYGAPIIDPAVWQAAQLALDARAGSRAPRVTTQVRNLFSGLSRCAECGGHMRVHRRSKDKVDLFECYSMVQGACTNRRRFRAAELEAWVLDTVHTLDLSEAKPASQDAEELARAQLARNTAAAQAEALLDLVEAGDAGAVARYRKRVAEHAEANATAQRLEAALQAASSAPSPADHQADVARLRGAMASAEGVERYTLRTRLAAALSNVIERVYFPSEGRVTLRARGAYEMVIPEGESRTLAWLWEPKPAHCPA